MKKFLLALLTLVSLSTSVFAASPRDISIFQWNSTGTDGDAVTLTPAIGTFSFISVDGVTGQLTLTGFGSGLTVEDSVLKILYPARVTATNNYYDLDNLPTIPQPDWTAPSDEGGYIYNKPTFSSVATSGAYADLSGKPFPTQALRVQTNAAGLYTWTFPTAYGSGVTPIIELTVEDGTAGNIWSYRIASISNTSVTIQLAKSTAVTVLGISVLGVAATPQAYVHLTANAP